MKSIEKIRIERCAPSRLDAVLDITRETIRTSYAAHYPGEAIRYFLDYHSPVSVLDDIESAYTVVLNDSGRIIGTGTLRGTTVKRVFVLPEFQGRGLGEIIMCHLEDFARQAGLRFLELHASLPAKRFYDSLEYRTLSFCRIPVENKKTLDYYRMARPLARDRAGHGWSLHGKRFRLLSDSGEQARGGVLFVFFQQKETVLAIRDGAEEEGGELIGFIEGDTLSFRFEDLDAYGMIDTGYGEASIKETEDGGLRLTGRWRSGGGEGLFIFEEEG